jgi:tetratricopeptide (TPR) repeat protein
MKRISTVAFGTAVLLLTGVTPDVTQAQSAPARPRIEGQLAQDFTAGKVPRSEEIAAAEKDAAAYPNDFATVRRLGKGYFFQYFGAGNKDAVPKAMATFDKALELKKDDPETLAYYGALYVFTAKRNDKNDPAKQKAGYDKGFELLQKAEKLAPRDGAVISITSGSYVDLPESYGMAPHIIGTLEGMRKGMGPAWNQFSHHGRQRLLLTLGRAYVQAGQPEKGRANFDEALAINGESTEANLLRNELAKLSPKP